ncbi:MAG: helix-turn-helix transcriptional regulator [Elusimicrobiota bacterium]
MKKVYQDIGARIRVLRQVLKLTQAEVAERAGIDSSFYGQIERGANVPSLRTLFAVAEVLRVEPAELLPKTRGCRKEDPLVAGALGSLLSRLKPGKRRFLMSMVHDLADELEG